MKEHFMKNLKLFGIIAFVVIMGLSMIACKDAEEEDITITVTGNFSAYNGWKAYIGLGVDDLAAFAMPLDVGASTSSLPFTMLGMDNKPFNKSGTYMVVLWFEKEGEDDANYYIYNKKINEGSNSIEFSSFSRLD
jgi:hypothetical protein